MVIVFAGNLTDSGTYFTADARIVVEYPGDS